MEIWKDIRGFEGYQVSNLGRVRTFSKTSYTDKHKTRHWKNRILKFKSCKQKIGNRVDLWKDGKPHTFLVHRLVADAFIGNFIDTKMTVNHKDGNRYNNNVDNLEWLSREENIRYGFNNNQYPQQNIVIVNLKTNEKMKFNSLSKASSYFKYGKGYFSSLIKKNKTEFARDGELYKLLF